MLDKKQTLLYLDYSIFEIHTLIFLNCYLIASHKECVGVHLRFYHNSIVFSVIERYSANSQEIIISQSERVFLVFIPPMPKTFSFRAITCPSILFKKVFPNKNVHNIILTNFAQALPINNFQVVRIIYIIQINP